MNEVLFAISILYGLIILICIICFFVMCANVSSIANSTEYISKQLQLIEERQNKIERHLKKSPDNPDEELPPLPVTLPPIPND